MEGGGKKTHLRDAIGRASDGAAVKMFRGDGRTQNEVDSRAVRTMAMTIGVP